MASLNPGEKPMIFRNYLRQETNEKRDYRKIYGYPDNLDGIFGYYLMRGMTRYNGIAARLNLGMPINCWGNGVEVKGRRDLTRLFKTIKLAQYFKRADSLNRIGRFSILFVGFPDKKHPKEPVTGYRESDSDKMYFRVYGYDEVTVLDTDNNPFSPRYGLPELYTLTSRPETHGVVTRSQHSSFVAHHSRVIHLCENKTNNDLEGMGYIEPIYGYLHNLDKTSGGAAEAYFKNAIGKIVFELDPEFSNLSEYSDDNAALRKHEELAEKFVNDMKTQLTVSGAKAKVVSTPHYSPLDTARVNLQMIAAYTRYPMRVLTGEGSGQLAGSEDRIALNSIITTRQNSFCVDALLQPFINMHYNYIGKEIPEIEFKFPFIEESTETESIENNKKKAETFKIATEAMLSAQNVKEAEFYSELGLNVELDDYED